MSSQNPLLIPEIVGIVLQHLDPPDLVKTAQVNSVWANEATKLIWRGDANSSVCLIPGLLKEIIDCSKERQSRYLGNIRYFGLSDSDIDGGTETDRLYERTYNFIDFALHKDDISDTYDYRLFAMGFLRRHIGAGTFSNLRSVFLGRPTVEVGEREVVELLSPNLTALKLWGRGYTGWFLEQVKIRAPFLKYLVVSSCWLTDDLTTFTKFLAAMPSIKHLVLDGDDELLIDEDVMKHLLFRSKLEKLCIRRDDTYPLNRGLCHCYEGPAFELSFWETLLQSKSDNQELFSSLRYLEISAQWEILESILPNLHHLQGLCITEIYRSSQSQRCVLDCLSSNAPIEEIRFYSHTIDYTMTSHVLLSLAFRFPLLRILVIPGRWKCNMTDEMIEKLVSNWPHLETLILPPLGQQASIESLMSFAYYCPRLFLLHTSIGASLEELEETCMRQGMAMPLLKILSMGKFSFPIVDAEEEKISIAEHIRFVFDGLFPALYVFKYIACTKESDLEFDLFVYSHLRARPGFTGLTPLGVSQKLTRRLLEPIPGSRFNPLA